MIEYCDTITESGCTYSGNLAVIRFFKTDGNFGSQSCLDALDKAKNEMFLAHPNAKVIIAFPVLVCKI